MKYKYRILVEDETYFWPQRKHWWYGWENINRPTHGLWLARSEEEARSQLWGIVDDGEKSYPYKYRNDSKESTRIIPFP